VDVSPATLRQTLYQMLLIRRFEERIGELFMYGKTAGSMFHLSIGQEAAAVGSVGALGPADYLTSTHRGHGHMIARGGDLNRMIAELCGKDTGYCKGKGGSMHIADLNLGHLGANGIVGGSLAIATGAALSLRRRGTNGVVLCIIGDGACNEGLFHESLNMAGLWRLPIIYFVENNQYAMSTSLERGFANPRIADRGPVYAMPGIEVDGMDVLQVQAVVAEAVARARSGAGATLVDCKVYRFFGHSRMDPAKYRRKEEETLWRERDPIDRFTARLKEQGVIDDAGHQALENEIRARLDEAVRFADESPYPTASQLFSDVYAEGESTRA